VQTAISAASAATTDRHALATKSAQSKPSDSPISFYHSLAGAAARGGWMNTPKRWWPSASRWSKASRRCRSTGRKKYAVRVQVDRQSSLIAVLASTQVNAAITNGNPNTAVGTLYGKTTNLTLQTNGQLSNAADFDR